MLQYSGYNLSLKDKEFIYEIYKSVYDDRGKLIKEQLKDTSSVQSLDVRSKSVLVTSAGTTGMAAK